MADDLFVLTGEQLSRIGAMLDWFENGAPSRQWKKEREPFKDTRRCRLAKTTTATVGGTYPAASTGCNTFWCKFLDAEFDGGYEDAAEGNNDSTFTAWTSGEKVLAHSMYEFYFPENTVVLLDQFNGQWWIQWLTGWLGKTDASHAKGASGTVSIWAGTPGSEVDTTVNLEGVYNRFADVGSGKWVWVMSNGCGYYLTAAECV